MYSTKKTYAYLAGLIDGDGHIAIVNRGENASNGYRVKLCIYNCNSKIIKLLQKTIGGKIRSNKINKKRPKWRDCIEYSCQDNRAADLIRNIQPFLIIKKEQAEIALTAIDTKNTYNKALGRWHPELKIKQYSKLKILKNKINELNIRGTNKRFEQQNIKNIPFNINYLAGFCDSDGSLMISKVGKYLAAKIKFTNTNKNIIDWIDFHIPNGSIYLKNSTNKKWNIGYELTFSNMNAYALADKLKTSLIIKNEQAHLLVKFGKTRHKYSSAFLRWNNDLNINSRYEQERIRTKCCELNRRSK
jgi:hypothetical protein